MHRAAHRNLTLAALALAFAFPAQAATETAPPASAPVRAAPTRPGDVSSGSISPAPAARPPAGANSAKPAAAARAPLTTSVWLDHVEYVKATDFARWLGFKLTWTKPNKTLVLTDPAAAANRVELEPESREAAVNGLRVFLGEKTILRGSELLIARIDAEVALAPLLQPGLGAKLLAPPKLIVLDPGHGGGDPGTQNAKFDLTEKILTLDVAQRTKKLLEAAGFKVVLTRTGDAPFTANKIVDLGLRPAFANRQGADLFISIHFNAAPNTRGTEVFTYAPAKQHATNWWGQVSTSDHSLETDDQPINAFDHWNVALAGALHRQLLQTLKTEDRGKKIAHWAVLKTLKCPGVLVEPAIITNDADARRVAVPAFRQQIAESLAAGVKDYAATLEALRTKT